MGKHLSHDTIKRYVDRKLDADELLSADDHLASCDECRAEAASESPVLNEVNFVTGDGALHLSFEQLSPYARGHADDVTREIAELHLIDCAQCRAELEALREVEKELASPVSTDAAPSFIDRISALVSPRSLGFAIPVVLLAIAGGVLYYVLKDRQTSVPVIEVASNETPNVIEPVESQPGPAEGNTLPNSEVAAVVLSDGGREFKLDGGGNVIGTFAAEYDRRIAAAVQSGTVPVSSEASRLKTSAGVLMGPGGDGALRVVSPVGKVLLSDRPEFRWSAIPGAESYRIEVFDANFSKVAESGKVSGQRWRPPTRLPRGREYTWQVAAVTTDGQTLRAPERPAPDARFLVLSAAKAAQIERARRIYPRSNLVLGLVYADAGLVDEAEAQLRQLVAKNPNSTAARKLLNSIRSRK